MVDGGDSSRTATTCKDGLTIKLQKKKKKKKKRKKKRKKKPW